MPKKNKDVVSEAVEVAKPKDEKAKKVKKTEKPEEPELGKREMIGSKKVVSAELVDGMVYAKDSVGSGFKFTLEQWNSSQLLS